MTPKAGSRWRSAVRVARPLWLATPYERRVKGTVLAIGLAFLILVVVPFLVDVAFLSIDLSRISFTLGGARVSLYSVLKVLLIIGSIAFCLFSGIVEIQLKRKVRNNDRLVCVQCGYALVDLDEEGVCPECGVEYRADEVRRAWEGYA